MNRTIERLLALCPTIKPSDPDFGYRPNFSQTVLESDLLRAENDLGLKFPTELRELYLSIGSLCIDTSFDGVIQANGTNNILDPETIGDILLGRGIFEDTDLALQEHVLPFFELDSGLFFVYDRRDYSRGIFFDYVGHDKTAEFASLWEFLDALMDNPNLPQVFKE